MRSSSLVAIDGSRDVLKARQSTSKCNYSWQGGISIIYSYYTSVSSFHVKKVVRRDQSWALYSFLTCDSGFFAPTCFVWDDPRGTAESIPLRYRAIC